MSTHVYSNGVMAGRDGQDKHRRVVTRSQIRHCDKPAEYDATVIDAGYCLDAPSWIPAGSWQGHAAKFGVAIESTELRGNA
jgi:hypothetical protein